MMDIVLKLLAKKADYGFQQITNRTMVNYSSCDRAALLQNQNL